MDPLHNIPENLAATVQAFDNERREPAAPRDAASVILMREGTNGPEVYLLRRRKQLAFAAGFFVFPGGGVDQRDFDTDLAWAGPSVAEWGRTIGCDEPMACALVCAAVRETFEEAGVLLAGASRDLGIADTTGEGWEADRLALEARELSLSDLLKKRGLVLRSDLLRFWAHWVTPHWEPRRFDTRFFVAVVPDGQVTRDVSSESDHVVWLPVASALEGVENDEIGMLPPTFVNCRDLAAHSSASAVMAAASGRVPTVVQPRVVVDEQGLARLALVE